MSLSVKGNFPGNGCEGSDLTSFETLTLSTATLFIAKLEFRSKFSMFLKKDLNSRNVDKLINQILIHYSKNNHITEREIDLVGLIEFIETLDSKSVKKLHGIDTVLGREFTEEFKARIIGNIQEYIHTLNNESI